MTADLAMVLALLAAAVAMFIFNRPRMDAVALIVIVALPLTGTVTMGEALAGFGDGNIVLIAALFVIGEALVRTGVARQMGDRLGAAAGSSETRLLVLLMLAAASLGAVMSSTAVVAIFIPVVLRICRNAGTSPSQLMMPLSVAALISGMLTLVATTPNLLVNAELQRRGHAGFDFFTITPFGLPILALGILYMLVARRWLGRAGTGPGTEAPALQPSLADWIARYRLADREHRVRIRPGSPLAGQRLAGVALRDQGLKLLAIERATPQGREMLWPTRQTELLAGDVLFIDAAMPDAPFAALRQRFGVDEIPLAGGAGFTDRTQDIGMAEALVSADSPLVGHTVHDIRARDDLGLTVIGLRRGAQVHTTGLLEERLAPGDTVLIVGFWSEIDRLRYGGSGLVVLDLPAERAEVLPAPGKAVHATAVLALVVGLMITGVVPNVQAAIFGCLLLGVLGCIDLDSAYRAINWKSLILIVGMLPFSIALQRTGGVDLAADALLDIVGDGSPRLVLGTLFVLTALLGLFISNTATAVLMAPVALTLAADLDASPMPFAMIVALAASSAFMAPISSPVNTLVVGPGNYSFGDFVRVGVPFALVVMAVSVLLVPVLLPLR
jgi:di/tricarboxylate transporter